MIVSRNQLYRGMPVLIDGKPYVVDEIIENLEEVHLRGERDVKQILSVADLRRAIHTDEISTVHYDKDSSDNSDHEKHFMNALSSKTREVTLRRLLIVQLLLELDKKSRTWPEKLAVLAKGIQLPNQISSRVPESKRTLQYWLSRYKVNGILGLVPNTDKCGTHTRYTLLYEEAAKEVIEKFMLTSESVSQEKLVSYASILYRQKCNHLGEKPTKFEGRKAFKSVLKKISIREELLARLDSRTARKLLKVSTRLNDVPHLLERVECDSTQLDIFIKFEASGAV